MQLWSLSNRFDWKTEVEDSVFQNSVFQIEPFFYETDGTGARKATLFALLLSRKVSAGV